MVVRTLALAATLGWVVPAALADLSAWDGDARAGVRIVSGGTKVEGGRSLLRGGVEIRLAPGWKTYWRYPGDSGVPPQFDFAKSENVKSVEVLWPAPERFAEADGTVIGYHTSVLFPLEIEPLDASKPVVVRLALDYAICEKVCIPAQAKAELAIKAGGKADTAIIAAEKSVPRAQPLGADAALSIKTVRRDESRKPARVLIDVAAPADAPVSIFAEGPTPDWALPVPDKVDGAPAGLQRFAFALDGLPPGASDKGATLKVTAVAGTEAIETTFRLD
ncbi:protein-disulfide reductase DsbD domain-containing protein [Pseudorhodoplanes sp.]|uniref:protein-disulfide reductase DsbD domain-containing protein n=1 Tax=Pseudorhodoplanes sp. TaxID=1934341 RepID=UPI002CCBB70D|nr:protein-disulfide reductase DsbD domain-containing protein [Pseudorhodoplanes sp.]HWV54582.1 protein-disulfide reductase DsbD domain-containing protein [Pseudorhodoplanes sp.]